MMASPSAIARIAAVDASASMGQPQAIGTPHSPENPMRAYRACLHCRSRKTKCNLGLNNGRPPCKRCHREGRDCVLGESHRGGRRVKKKPKLEDDDISVPENNLHSLHSDEYTPDHVNARNPQLHQSMSGPNGAYDSRYDSRFPWPPPTVASSETSSYSRSGEQTSPNTTGYPQQARSPLQMDSQHPARAPVRESIALADLQNPSDALDILARVADRAEGDSPGSGQVGTVNTTAATATSKSTGYLYYKPTIDGLISPETVYRLFETYEMYYHPYFPIVPRENFDRHRIPWLSKAEPHLFSAILTIASKDDERTHRVCYDYMQELISSILAGADADVDAVEALLILAQWVSNRPTAEPAVGRGEEDRVAWMYIGTALRLAYFVGIDRTAFRADSIEEPPMFHRKRLVWAACYICDRSVSVRLGKGFWARGPGPLSGLRSSDFPSLQPAFPNGDDMSMIFQANLELTQIFSNVHDILYSSKGHGWKQMLEGRYAKYLDDFRTSIRIWNDSWGAFSCSPHLKASMLLSYHYLRVYVNAFAYQATISRAMTFSRESKSGPIPLLDAATYDARFIYEAIDGAKSLLTTCNEFIEPETLRYMPCSHYLYIVYSAVFLYKARSTTTMADEERLSIRRMVSQITERLDRASVGPNHMGSRYSRLLQLLWRKAPKGTNRQERPPIPSINHQLQAPMVDTSHMAPPQPFSPYNELNMANDPAVMDPRTGGMFSWLDLAATWNYATQNNSVSGSAAEMDGMLGEAGSASGFSTYDMNLNLPMTDYGLLSDDNPNLIF